MPPEKILFLQATSEIGGTDITLLRTVEVLNREKFEPHVVFPKDGPLVENFRRAGCIIHFLPGMRQLSSRRGLLYLLQYLLGFIPAVLRLTSLIRREKIGLVHTNTIHNFYGFPAAWFTGTPHVWHVREIVVQSQVIRALEIFLVPRFSRKFLVMSDAIFEMFRKSAGFPQNGVKLYDGVDLQRFHPQVSGKRIRQELGLDEKTPLIGSVTRLDPWKGLDIFLEAAAEVHKQRPDARFLICGGEIDGHKNYKETLQQKAQALGVGPAVFFTDWKYRAADIPEIYGALDISVQSPVLPEPYGLAAVEAMASGVPIAAPREGGPAELCEDGKTALLFPPRNSSALAVMILKLLQDPGLAKRMGDEGRRRAEKYFDRNRCVQALEEIYSQILAARKAA